jgi:hypothetical protein
MNGGPGQDLSFYGYQSAAAFPLQGTTSPEPTFTLEFWVAPRCSNIKCTFFTLQSSNASEYVENGAGSMFLQRLKWSLSSLWPARSQVPSYGNTKSVTNHAYYLILVEVLRLCFEILCIASVKSSF